MSTEARGIECPTCGCQHCPQDPTRVERTIALGGNRSIMRVRICRHCGRRFTTSEKVIGGPQESNRQSATGSTLRQNLDLDD